MFSAYLIFPKKKQQDCHLSEVAFEVVTLQEPFWKMEDLLTREV